MQPEAFHPQDLLEPIVANVWMGDQLTFVRRGGAAPDVGSRIITEHAYLPRFVIPQGLKSQDPLFASCLPFSLPQAYKYHHEFVWGTVWDRPSTLTRIHMSTAAEDASQLPALTSFWEAPKTTQAPDEASHGATAQSGVSANDAPQSASPQDIPFQKLPPAKDFPAYGLPSPASPSHGSPPIGETGIEIYHGGAQIWPLVKGNPKILGSPIPEPNIGASAYSTAPAVVVLPHERRKFTVKGAPEQRTIEINSQILSAGGPALVINGVQAILDPENRLVLESTRFVHLPTPTLATSGPAVTILSHNGQKFGVSLSPDQRTIEIDSQTLDVGGPARIINGIQMSLASDSKVVIGGT